LNEFDISQRSSSVNTADKAMVVANVTAATCLTVGLWIIEEDARVFRESEGRPWLLLSWEGFCADNSGKSFCRTIVLTTRKVKANGRDAKLREARDWECKLRAYEGVQSSQSSAFGIIGALLVQC
jgi:hypothetical protein